MHNVKVNGIAEVPYDFLSLHQFSEGGYVEFSIGALAHIELLDVCCVFELFDFVDGQVEGDLDFGTEEWICFIFS